MIMAFSLFICGGHLINLLLHQIDKFMIHLREMALITKRCSQALSQTHLAIHAASKREPKSDDIAPPSKSARMVIPAMVEKRSCSGVSFVMVDLVCFASYEALIAGSPLY